MYTHMYFVRVTKDLRSAVGLPVFAKVKPVLAILMNPQINMLCAFVPVIDGSGIATRSGDLLII